MRLYFSPLLLLLLLLIGCSKSNHGADIPEGRLDLVWSVQPEEADGELWFGEIKYVTAAGDYIYVTDVGRDVVIQLDTSGQFVRTIGRKGGGPGEFITDPAYISVSPSGHIFIEHFMAHANEYSSSGDFVKHHVAQGLKLEEAPSIMLEWPIALDDSTLVWRVYQMGLENLDDILQVPPLAATRGEEIIPLGEKYLKELERLALTELMSRTSGDMEVMWFTLGEAILSNIRDELLYLKDDDPYTIYRFSMVHSPTSFTFHQEKRDRWLKTISMPREEFLNRDQSVDIKYWGEKFFINPDSNRMERYNFTHMRRGMARYGESLVVHVESVTDEFKPGIPGVGFDQCLYVVNLSTEQSELRIKLNNSFPYELRGALEDGTLIFSTNEPVPGILAYRIVPD